MTLQELQELLEEQHKDIKAIEVDGGFVITNNLIVVKNFSKKLSDILEVRGSIDMSKGASLELAACQSVGGSIVMREGAILNWPGRTEGNTNWGKNNGDIVANVLYSDNIYTLFKNKKTIENYTVYRGACVGVLNVITDGKNWAHYHGDIRNGIIDLRFKSEKHDKSVYSDLTLNSLVKYEDAVLMYRILTGACRDGVSAFIKTITIKDKYTIKEIIELTKNQYGSKEFASFFSGGKK